MKHYVFDETVRTSVVPSGVRTDGTFFNPEMSVSLVRGSLRDFLERAREFQPEFLSVKMEFLRDGQPCEAVQFNGLPLADAETLFSRFDFQGIVLLEVLSPTISLEITIKEVQEN